MPVDTQTSGINVNAHIQRLRLALEVSQAIIQQARALCRSTEYALTHSQLDHYRPKRHDPRR